MPAAMATSFDMGRVSRSCRVPSRRGTVYAVQTPMFPPGSNTTGSNSGMRDAWIDWRGTAQPENVLQRLRGAKDARLAARRTGDLQADRQVLLGKAARQRHRGAACDRDRIGDREPFDIVRKLVAVHLGDVAVLDRVRRDHRRGREQQVVSVEERQI